MGIFTILWRESCENAHHNRHTEHCATEQSQKWFKIGFWLWNFNWMSLVATLVHLSKYTSTNFQTPPPRMNRDIIVLMLHDYVSMNILFCFECHLFFIYFFVSILDVCVCFCFYFLCHFKSNLIWSFPSKLLLLATLQSHCLFDMKNLPFTKTILPIRFCVVFYSWKSNPFAFIL